MADHWLFKQPLVCRKKLLGSLSETAFDGRCPVKVNSYDVRLEFTTEGRFDTNLAVVRLWQP